MLCQKFRAERIVHVPNDHLQGIEASHVILSQWNAVLNAERQIRISQEVSAKHDSDFIINIALVNGIIGILWSMDIHQRPRLENTCPRYPR